MISAALSLLPVRSPASQVLKVLDRRPALPRAPDWDVLNHTVGTQRLADHAVAAVAAAACRFICIGTGHADIAPRMPSTAGPAAAAAAQPHTGPAWAGRKRCAACAAGVPGAGLCPAACRVVRARGRRLSIRLPAAPAVAAPTCQQPSHQSRHLLDGQTRQCTL